MKVEIPQINWHGKEPVLSIDFYPFSNLFVTCGHDDSGSNMRVIFWELVKKEKLDQPDGGKDPKDPLSNLEWIPVFKYSDNSFTQQPSVVRWSPNGTHLASAGSNDSLSLWDYKMRSIEMNSFKTEPRWGVCKNLRGHFWEITDISWSRDEKFIATASVDNSAILWNVEKGSQVQRFEAHKNYVSGITVDPFFNYIITQSTDKTVKVHKNIESDKSAKFYIKNNIYKRKFIKDESNQLVVLTKEQEDELLEDEAKMKEKGFYSDSHRMFLDDSEVFCFSRRLTFSPDGSLLIIPCGLYQHDKSKEEINYCCYGFTRKNLSEPAFILPSGGTCPIVVKFHPLLFKRAETDEPFIDLPYIMVFAVATQDQIMIYKTQSLYPYCVISNMHYAELTDLSWTKDKLLASSRDGYVTTIIFEEEELGVPLELHDIPENLQDIFGYVPMAFRSGQDVEMQEDE